MENTCALTQQNCMQVKEKSSKHPCFSLAAHKKYARMHLPVAPACNLSCNYCSRKFDCPNESRPGVSSEILSPRQAYERFLYIRERIPNLSVVGIAGPGDALADWQHTRSTLEFIRKADTDVSFCLSTNGLLLPQYADELLALGVDHVTVTVNALDPAVSAKIYRRINFNGQYYQGPEAGELLLHNQLRGIARLTRHGVVVKVNTVMIAGINDRHIPEISKAMKELGVTVSNIVPLIPVKDSALANWPQTSMRELLAMRQRCEADLPQMQHCRQCRADAIGLLGEDLRIELVGGSKAAQEAV